MDSSFSLLSFGRNPDAYRNTFSPNLHILPYAGIYFDRVWPYLTRFGRELAFTGRRRAFAQPEYPQDHNRDDGGFLCHFGPGTNR